MAMLALVPNRPICALLLFGGSGEIMLIVASILILFGAKKIPEFARGLGEGFSEFRKSLKSVSKKLDQEAHDAGESLGGIHGKPAGQALTPDNQIAELYDPAVFHDTNFTKGVKFRGPLRLWRLVWHFLSKRLHLKI